MSIEALYGFFAVLIGLSIGSFLNVVALRGLSGESIVFPPSKCPKCGKKLNWYTNIPVISYIFLLGKCQFCKQPISVQYPIVESANAILYLIMFLNFGVSLKTLILWAVTSIFILICITDFKEQVIIDLHTYILIGLGLLYNILKLGSISILDSILGILAGYLIFEILARIGTITVKTRAFGEGDTLIAMGLGALLGWKMLILTIFISMLIQAIFTIPVLFIKYFKNKNYLSAFALILIVLCIISTKFVNPNFDYYIIYLTILCTILLFCLLIILKNIKSQESFCYLPFGPALVTGALFIIFFAKKILVFFS